MGEQAGNVVDLAFGALDSFKNTNLSFSIDQETIDASNMTDASWEEILGGKLDCSISVTCLLATSNDVLALIEAWADATVDTLSFSRLDVTASNEFAGVEFEGFISKVDLSASDNEAASCTFEFVPSLDGFDVNTES